MNDNPRLSARVAGARRVPRPRRDRRVVVLQVAVLALLGTLLARLAYVQLIEGGEYRQAAASNSIREVVTNAPRGLVLDQVGRPLVSNRSALVIAVDRTELQRQPRNGDQVLEDLGALLGEAGSELRERMKPCGTAGAPPQPKCWNGPSTQPVVVADEVSEEVGLAIIEQRDRLPGVRASMAPVRAYPRAYGVNAAHLVGYLGPVTEAESKAQAEDPDAVAPSQVGRAGLEQQYDQILRGRPGVQRVALNRNGQVSRTVIDTQPEPGANLVTSIDARLQAVVEQELGKAIARARDAGKPADSGGAVVLDVTDGRVLAMASAPTYDPKIWAGGISSADYQRVTDPKSGIPLLNRATQGLFAPASTYKPFAAIGALASGYSASRNYDCPSAVNIGGQRFTNYHDQAYGSISLARALAVSCDTVFYRFGQQLWERDGGLDGGPGAKEAIAAAARSFGLGATTGIDLPGEYRGRVDSRATKQARYEEMKDAYCRRARDGYPELGDPARSELLRGYARDYCADGARLRVGDAVNASIGQGDTAVTPLQIAAAYAAIANGGTLWRPQIARAAVDRNGVVLEEFGPRKAGRVDVPAHSLPFLRDALARTPIDGTAAEAFRGFPLRAIPIGAKTGTGEVVGKETTAWFASFAPADSARYAVVCVVSQGGTGSGTCGPAVRAIYEALFGVVGSTVNPDRSILQGHEPSDSIPSVSDDGVGVTSPTVNVDAVNARPDQVGRKPGTGVSSPGPR